jgi:hypothetical protein
MMIDTATADLTRVLFGLRALSPDDRDRRTSLLRDLGAAVVNLREHVTTSSGTPDWPGRTGTYRAAIQHAYGAAGYGPDEAAATQKAARYHVANALRTRLSPEDLLALGLRVESPAERQTEIRERHAAIVASVAADDLDDLRGALAALTRARSSRNANGDPGRERVLRAIIARAEDLLRQG